MYVVEMKKSRLVPSEVIRRIVKTSDGIYIFFHRDPVVLLMSDEIHQVDQSEIALLTSEIQ